MCQYYKKLVEDYINQMDWRIKENSNMAFSLQGLNNYIASHVTSQYWMKEIYDEEMSEAHIKCKLHLHDLGSFSMYCCGWDLLNFLLIGFGGVSGKVESLPPKHFRSALGQMVNFLYSVQGEVSGAVAFSNFDTLLAPFVRFDGLTYKEVKQGIQEFVFNMNVPTRVGFQCVSEDTEVLTKEGWKSHNELTIEDTIATFNTNTQVIEYQKNHRTFSREYKGKMYNLKNRISDQLISPNHRVVRKIFNTNKYTIQPIEEVINFKSPLHLPVGSLGNVNGRGNLSNEELLKVLLVAFIISDGSRDFHGNGVYRISIYQSKLKHYELIKNSCDTLGLTYSLSTQKGLGNPTEVIRFNSESTREILTWFDKDDIKRVPRWIKDLDKEYSRLFLDYYIMGDEHEEVKIVSTSLDILNDLMEVCVNAGYGATLLPKKLGSPLSKKKQYILRLIRHTDTFIMKVEEVNYSGVIWCPNTKNGTFVARRNGKVFITGNSPFSNVTMDLNCPGHLSDMPVIIGGKTDVYLDEYGNMILDKDNEEYFGELKTATFKDFQKEMDMLNKAFCEVMMEGDAKGRIFSFPIPTYNITKTFDWDNPKLDKIWEMTAKYGVGYFANFVNSDMEPDDVFSLCCRLRLDKRELKNRGGGLFGSNPLTGSIGVVTLNLPRAAFISNSKEEFLNELKSLIIIARRHLKTKRSVIEDFTEGGLYPYSKHYLKSVKESKGEYWANHFNTIGVLGMHEACLNLIGTGIDSEEGKQLAVDTLSFIREHLQEFQEEDGQLYNLEATPGEGTTYRFAKGDKKSFGDKIIQSGEGDTYYTNSTHLPVGYTDDIFGALEHQDDLQVLYTGGCVEKGNKVLTNFGLIEIEEIVENIEKYEGLKVVSYNKDKGLSEWSDVEKGHKIDVSKDDKIRVVAERGLDITTSDWHPFFVLDRFVPEDECPVCGKKVKGKRQFAAHLRYNKECRTKYKEMDKYRVVEKRADELKKNDYILQNSNNMLPDTTSRYSDDLMWLVGYYISDGSMSMHIDNRGGNNLEKPVVRFHDENTESLSKCAYILNINFGCNVSVRSEVAKGSKVSLVSTNKSNVVEFLMSLGFSCGSKTYDVKIPKVIKDSINKNNVYSLLSGFMDGDGHIDNRQGDFEYSTVSECLVFDIIELLSNAGISCGFSKKISKRNNESPLYRLRIPCYELFRIKDKLIIKRNFKRIITEKGSRTKRHLPVVRVKSVSKVDVEDNMFYDLTVKDNHNYLCGKNTLVFIHNTVLHGFLGEKIDDPEICKTLVRRIAENFHLPYFTITPTFSVCPEHGYVKGEHKVCPQCHE